MGSRARREEALSKILVTGAAGFIGSHLCDELICAGHDVVAIDDLSGGFIENLPREATFHQGTILNEHFIEKLFSRYKFEYVFHLAAYAAEGLSHFIRRYNYRNNLIGSVNLINAAVNHGVRTFVFTSSMAVYGSQQVPYVETMIPQPEDPYGIAKAAVERELKVAHDMFGMDYVIFRPHNVYGERQNIGDRYRNVIGIFMNQIMNGEPMTVFGDGEQVRAFSYISDIAPVIARGISEPKALGRIFNIGGEQPMTINHLANEVSRAMSYATPNVLHVPPRVEVREAHCDHSARREVFGDYDPVPLDVGLAKMASWAWAHGARVTKKFAEIEITKNIPGKWL
jgi:UDP-glucose 4-epimerase